MKSIFIIASFMLVLALFTMPYGFYQILRLIVCATLAYHVWSEYSKTKNITSLSCLFGLLYNPIFVVHFNRSIWFFINILTLIYFVYLIYNIKDKK